MCRDKFSNETALIRTSDGGMARLNEFRRVGGGGRNSVYMSMFGTQGSFEEHANGSMWSSLKWGETIDLSEQLSCRDDHVKLNDDYGIKSILSGRFSKVTIYQEASA